MRRCGSAGASADTEAGDQAAIDELVLINRMLASKEMGILGAYGHVSVRNRHEPSHYFISSLVPPGIVTIGDIYESDLESRPDVMAVVFTIAPELTAFSVTSVSCAAWIAARVA